MAAKIALQSLVRMCESAIDLDSENDGLRRFAVPVMHMAASIEENINAILGLHRIITLEGGDKYLKGPNN